MYVAHAALCPWFNVACVRYACLWVIFNSPPDRCDYFNRRREGMFVLCAYVSPCIGMWSIAVVLCE